MKVRSDITKLERLGWTGAEFTINPKGEVTLFKTKEVVYEPESREEAKKLKEQQGQILILHMHGSAMAIKNKATKETILEWSEELAVPRLFAPRGVTDNDGKEREDIDILPYLTLALSDEYGVPIVIIKDNITRRVDHLALFGGKVAVNQRGEVYDYARIRGTSNYCEVIKSNLSAKEAREYYKEKKIDHTTRETKKQMRQIVVGRPMIFEIQIRTGYEIRTEWVTDYKETKEKVLFKSIVNGEIQPRDMGIQKGTMLGIQIQGLR